MNTNYRFPREELELIRKRFDYELAEAYSSEPLPLLNAPGQWANALMVAGDDRKVLVFRLLQQASPSQIGEGVRQAVKYLSNKDHLGRPRSFNLLSYSGFLIRNLYWLLNNEMEQDKMYSMLAFIGYVMVVWDYVQASQTPYAGAPIYIQEYHHG